jgi:hypothetical protein
MWFVTIVFAGLGFLIIGIEREILIRKKLKTKFGMIETPAKKDGS